MRSASSCSTLATAVLLLALPSAHAFVDVPGARIGSSRRQSSPMQAQSIPNLDDSNKDQILADDRTVVIDAYATFCGPCKLIEPVVERCAAERGDIQFVKYNVVRYLFVT